MPEAEAARPRYFFLDELRGLAIVLMTLYHALYLLAFVFASRTGRILFDFMGPVQPFIAGTFILLCGLCCRFSRSNWKRGLKLAGAAALVTLATLAMTLFGLDEVIWFGVLHFLACAVLLFALAQKATGTILAQKPFEKRSKKVNFPPWILFAVCMALFFVWYIVPPPLPYSDFFLLFALGFPSVTLRSADYFPLFPWLFLFLTGTALGAYGARGRFPRWMEKPRVPPLRWLGKHSLLIYLLHQPVLFGLFFALEAVGVGL